MAFDITSVLKGVSGPDTGKEQIEYIPVDQIDPDPNNFYSLDGLDELAGNIELIGLQQPLRVRPGEDGRFIVVSGHRRRAAILMIRDGGSEMFRDGVPCIVDRGEESPAMRELRLIYANASTRVMGPAEISKQAERTEMLLYQLKEEGVIEFPGRMRDHVAEACRISKTKLARLHRAGDRGDRRLRFLLRDPDRRDGQGRRRPHAVPVRHPGGRRDLPHDREEKATAIRLPYRGRGEEPGRLYKAGLLPQPRRRPALHDHERAHLPVNLGTVPGLQESHAEHQRGRHLFQICL